MGRSDDLPTSFEFRSVSEADRELLLEWHSRPHVLEWWPETPSPEEIQRYSDRPADGFTGATFNLAMLEGTGPVGFIQSYLAIDGHDDGWWLDENDPGVVGIDQFLANADQLNRGIGSAMVSAFAKRLFTWPWVTRIQADPSSQNLRAIRCYQKAGFRAQGEITTPDGRAILIVLDRGVP